MHRGICENVNVRCFWLPFQLVNCPHSHNNIPLYYAPLKLCNILNKNSLPQTKKTKTKAIGKKFNLKIDSIFITYYIAYFFAFTILKTTMTVNQLLFSINFYTSQYIWSSSCSCYVRSLFFTSLKNIELNGIAINFLISQYCYYISLHTSHCFFFDVNFWNAFIHVVGGLRSATWRHILERIKNLHFLSVNKLHCHRNVDTKISIFSFLSSSSTLAMKMVGSCEKKVSGKSIRGGVHNINFMFIVKWLPCNTKNIFSRSCCSFSWVLCEIEIESSRWIVVNKFWSLIPFCHRTFGGFCQVRNFHSTSDN